MKITVKKYTHTSTGEGSEQKHSATPESKLKKMIEDGEQFSQYSSIQYNESEFESVDEFLAFDAPSDVKVDIINRGWTLAQQGAGRALVLEDNTDYVNTDSPVDLTEAAITPKERKKAPPEVKARRALTVLEEADPEELAAILAEWNQRLTDAKQAAGQ